MENNREKEMYDLLIKALKEKVYLETLLIKENENNNLTPVSRELYNSLKLEYSDKTLKSMQDILSYVQSDSAQINNLNFYLIYDFSNIVDYFVQIMARITGSLPQALIMPNIFMSSIEKSLNYIELKKIIETFHNNLGLEI